MSLYGVRLFFNLDNQIVSPIKRMVWDSSIQQAECIDYSVMPTKHHPASAPAEGCSCGFYATWTVKAMLECANRDSGGFALSSGLEFAVGLVQAYGKVVTHEYGFRAEYMRIMGFMPVKAVVDGKTYQTDTKLFGFPILISDKKLKLINDVDFGIQCAKLINVECVFMEPAKLLLRQSERNNK